MCVEGLRKTAENVTPYNRCSGPHSKRVPLEYKPNYVLCFCSQDQVFPNLFGRGPLLASQNNHGSSHPCSRKYKVSG